MTMIGTQPGKLRHSVVLQSPTPTQDAAGQPIPSWASVVTVLARVEAVGGGERWLRFKTEATVDTMVEIRYRSDVAPEWRVAFDGRVLHVTQVIDPEGHKRKQYLFCREVKE